MSDFNLSNFIESLKLAAVSDSAVKSVNKIMQDAMQDVEAVAEAMNQARTDNKLEFTFFEDDHLSVQYVRFEPNRVGPAHDHQLAVCIGVINGTEINHFYRAGHGSLEHINSKELTAGEYVSFGPQTIHSARSKPNSVSEAIHIYLGSISKVKRSLFLWETGEAVPMDMDTYYQLEYTESTIESSTTEHSREMASNSQTGS